MTITKSVRLVQVPSLMGVLFAIPKTGNLRPNGPNIVGLVVCSRTSGGQQSLEYYARHDHHRSVRDHTPHHKRESIPM